jgi:flagellar secretion chaperone FliS
MAYTIYDKYREEEILNADPVQLVSILYRGALDAVGAARKHLATGEIRPRSRQIVKAWEILHELSRALDHTQGGDLSRNLQSLYAYMQTRLMEANSLQADAPLQEVERLLATLQEGWQQVPAVATIANDGELQRLRCTY